MRVDDRTVRDACAVTLTSDEQTAVREAIDYHLSGQIERPLDVAALRAHWQDIREARRVLEQLEWCESGEDRRVVPTGWLREVLEDDRRDSLLAARNEARGLAGLRAGNLRQRFVGMTVDESECEYARVIDMWLDRYHALSSVLGKLDPERQCLVLTVPDDVAQRLEQPRNS